MSENPQGVFIDDVEFPFDDSSSILAFTDKALGDKIITTLCNDDNLNPYGACRVCSVEVQQSEDGPRRTVASCHTPVTPGMRILLIRRALKNFAKILLSLF